MKSKPLILCLCFWVSDHPELYKDKEGQGASRGAVEPPAEGGRDVGNRRQAATDEIMLERFRKRERSRLMRRWDHGAEVLSTPNKIRNQHWFWRWAKLPSNYSLRWRRSRHPDIQRGKEIHLQWMTASIFSMATFFCRILYDAFTPLRIGVCPGVQWLFGFSCFCKLLVPGGCTTTCSEIRKLRSQLQFGGHHNFNFNKAKNLV